MKLVGKLGVSALTLMLAALPVAACVLPGAPDFSLHSPLCDSERRAPLLHGYLDQFL